MLDIIGTIFATALYAVLAGALIAVAPMRAATRLVALAAAAAWLALIAAAAALGAFAPGTLGPVPAILLPFSGILALLFGSWFFAPRARAALLAVPLPLLVAVNAGRIGGLFFLLLYADGRLSAPFAQSAGWGDVITGALALPLAALLALGFRLPRAWLALWNAFGTLDLVAAISLGLLSAPGTPFRLFTEGPGTLAMTALPWILVPSTLVPIFLLLHAAIAARLGALPRATQAVALAGGRGAA